MRELLLPLAVITILISLLLPLPGGVLDFLLVGNILLALALLVSTLYLPEPLKLSSLPTILLLATLYRLALNVSTTRAILGGESIGQVIQTFGSLMTHGNLLVGAVVFSIITLVQFVVIAKGSERVAEVSARFVLDALPGRQMSIDADLRSGLIGVEQARIQRQELQTESQFYGALDGSMKFIKGDAIAGLIITLVNVVGGLLIGILVHGLDITAALSHYTLLTIGDGLLSQIPALLNSISAGLVVTRVTRGDGAHLAHELFLQLGQIRKVKLLVGGLALVLGLVPALPTLPFVSLAAVFLVSFIIEPKAVQSGDQVREGGEISSIRVELKADLTLDDKQLQELEVGLGEIQNELHTRIGVTIVLPEVRFVEELPSSCVVFVNDVQLFSLDRLTGSELLGDVLKRLDQFVSTAPHEILDDRITHRILLNAEKASPGITSGIIPEIISMTQLTKILKVLVHEQVNVVSIGAILQAVAESAGNEVSERRLIEDVRIALRRSICHRVASSGRIDAYMVAAGADMDFARTEREGVELNMEALNRIASFFKSSNKQNGVLLASKSARRLVRECLGLHKLDLPVLAHEEIVEDVELHVLGQLPLEEGVPCR